MQHIKHDTRLRFHGTKYKKGMNSGLFERYRVAKTVKEALDLGSTVRHIEYDIKHGFCFVEPNHTLLSDVIWGAKLLMTLKVQSSS